VDEFVKHNYKMVKSRKGDEVVQRLKEALEDFKQYMPLLQEVSNPALEPRHWQQIFAIVGAPFDDSGAAFCAQDLIAFGIVEKYEQVQTVAAAASKEFSMLKMLEKMEAEWGEQAFHAIPYKDSGTFIVSATDEIQTILDDQIVKIQAMNASPFVKPFKERASQWELTLQTLQVCPGCLLIELDFEHLGER
jgi:dynein heavy chain, axonemal